MSVKKYDQAGRVKQFYEVKKFIINKPIESVKQRNKNLKRNHKLF